MSSPVYLDYNATTPIDPEVVREMIPYIESYFGNPSSSYSIGNKNQEAIEKARRQVANLVNASPEEITFTSGGTESNNHAILGAAMANQEKGKHIITSSIEHPAVTNVCRHLALKGWDISWLPVDHTGRVGSKDVARSVRPDTVLVSIMHANNEVGTIQAIEEISAITKQNKILFHTDAAQSLGKLPTDVNELGIDLLSIAGHKLYAPKGIGALYIKKGVSIENLIHGAEQENGIRPGTENVGHIVALGKACQIARRDFDRNRSHMHDMRLRLLEGLQSRLKNLKVHTPLDSSLPNTLSIAFEKVDAQALTSFIAGEVFISTGSACHSGHTEISSVLKAMNIDLVAATNTVRISTGKYTTEKEIDIAIETISRAVLQNSKLTFLKV
ncbi:MAG: cysteine desulfurase family protein [Bacteroidota bacterium]|nr:cysteine desulfurase family protein [Bacteroidota bacterium]